MRVIIIIIIKIIIEYANRLSNFKYNNELYNIENIVYLLQNFANETNSFRSMLISKFVNL